MCFKPIGTANDDKATENASNKVEISGDEEDPLDKNDDTKQQNAEKLSIANTSDQNLVIMDNYSIQTPKNATTEDNVGRKHNEDENDDSKYEQIDDESGQKIIDDVKDDMVHKDTPKPIVGVSIFDAVVVYSIIT